MEAAPSMWRLVGRGVRRRCPACGAGDVFETWFRLRERCPRCAARLEREPAFFIGAYFLNFCLMQAVLGAWIVAAFALTLPDPPMPLILGVAVAICVLVPILGYPFAKTTWAAIHLGMAPFEPDEEADAAVFRFERGDADDAGEPRP